MDKYDFTWQTFKTNLKNLLSKPQDARWWIWICLAFFFAGIWVSGQYYQDQCNSYVIKHFLEPESEFRQRNPMLVDYESFNLTDLFKNETKLSPIKQITNKIS